MSCPHATFTECAQQEAAFALSHRPSYHIPREIQLTNMIIMKHFSYLAATVPFAYSKTSAQLCAGTAEQAPDGN